MEPQQHHGGESKPAATVDPEALGCPVCSQFPLVQQIMQKLSRISITGGEKEKISSSMGSVVRMGPCGGSGGDANWDMDMRGVNRIVGVVVRHGDAVDAISVLYERDGREEWTDLWGGLGGMSSEIRLKQDEYLTSVKGHYGRLGLRRCVIRSLTFVGNHRSFGPYGKEEGVPFELPAAGGGRILGFHARSGTHLDALGTYVKMH